MAKNNGREAAKRLMQQIEVTTDPKTLIELTRQLAKLLPKKRKRKKLFEEKVKQDKLIRPKEGSAVDDLSDEKLVMSSFTFAVQP
jgi:hypothetical protein